MNCSRRRVADDLSDSGGHTPSELSSPSPSFPRAYTASSASRRAHPDHDPPFRAHTQHRTPTAPRHQRPPASPLRVTTEPELRRPRRAPGELASVAYAGVGDGMAPSCRSRSRRGCRSRMVTSRGQPPLCGRRLCRSNGAGLEPREETCIGCSRRDSARVSGRAADNKSPGRGRIPAQRRVSVRRAYDRDARNTFSTTAPARGPELSKIADKLPAASAGYRSRLACRQRVQCLNFSCFSRSFTASFVGMMGFQHVVFTGGVAWEWVARGADNATPTLELDHFQRRAVLPPVEVLRDEQEPTRAGKPPERDLVSAGSLVHSAQATSEACRDLGSIGTDPSEARSKWASERVVHCSRESAAARSLPPPCRS